MSPSLSTICKRAPLPIKYPASIVCPYWQATIRGVHPFKSVVSIFTPYWSKTSTILMCPFTQAQWIGWAPNSLLLAWSIGPLLSMMNLKMVMWPPKQAQWAGVWPFSSRMLKTSGPSSAMVWTGTNNLKNEMSIPQWIEMIPSREQGFWFPTVFQSTIKVQYHQRMTTIKRIQPLLFNHVHLLPYFTLYQQKWKLPTDSLRDKFCCNTNILLPCLFT